MKTFKQFITESFWKTINGDDVYKNPGKKEIMEVLSKIEFHGEHNQDKARWLIDEEENLYVWFGLNSVHDAIKQQLTYRPELWGYITHERNVEFTDKYVYTLVDARDIIKRVFKKAKFRIRQIK